MIDKNKQYTTRSGLPASVYKDDGIGQYPVCGEILHDHGPRFSVWNSEGVNIIGRNGEDDLIEIDCEEGEGL